MGTWQIGRDYIMRTALLALVVASLAFAVAQSSGAAQTPEESHRNTMTQIQVCEAMGGKPIIDTEQNANGEFFSRVRCVGGALDGMDCTNDRYLGTDCTFARFDRDHNLVVPEPDGIAPLDEPTATPPIGSVGEVDTIAPVATETPVTEVTATPTPEATAEVVAEEPTEVTGEVVDEPVVDDGAIIDEVVAPGMGEEPTVSEPGIDDGRSDGAEDIGPDAVVTLT